MTKYISKSALVAEIERRLNHQVYLSVEREIREQLLSGLLLFIDNLESKEVDLEKEIDNYISSNFFGSQTLGFFANRTKEEPNDQDIALCAKHFYSLGLAQKGK